MLVLVIYDISDNHTRNEIIKKLRHFGLHRIQKSAFIGNLKNNERNELENEFEEFISGFKDSIYVVPVCSECRRLTKIYSVEDRNLEDTSNFKIV